MKSAKFAVLGSTLLAVIAVFLPWISVSGDAGLFGSALPRSGMDNGGPVFLFFLMMPLVGAGIGALKRYGRGLAALSFVGGLLTVFMALVKYADIDGAAGEAKQLDVVVSAAAGYWVFFVAASAICAASLAALIRPEKKPAPAPMAHHAFPMQVGP